MQVLTLLLCAIAVVAVSAVAPPADLANNVEGFLATNAHHTRRKYRPIFHLASPYGWLNDPAAFVYFKRKFHLFYQYHPYDGSWGPMHWGHAVSDDLVDWAHYPPALIPRELYDRHGCFAGSAIIHNDYLALFYTGHRIIGNNTFNTINVAISADGIIFQKYLYNPVIRNGPPDVDDFRNPKVWHHKNTYYMLVGASVKRSGQVFLYTSPDLYRWRFNRTVAESYGDMGFMWESPDVFQLDNANVLLLSVQGILPQEHRFRNLQHTGYVVGHFDYASASFEDLEVSHATFYELDHGHDFYAAKTTWSPDGRRLMVAWLGMWESSFLESKDGWAGVMTIVRELSFGKNGQLLVTPVREAFDLREEVLEDASYSPGEGFQAGSKAFEMLLNVSSTSYDVSFALEWEEKEFTVFYSALGGYVTIDRGDEDGVRRASWTPTESLRFRVFFDRSTVEVFCGDGEVVFSSRIYPSKPIYIKIGGEIDVHVRQYRLRHSIGYDDNLHSYLANYFLTWDKKHDYHI